MHMIAHEDVGVDRAVAPAGCLGQALKIEPTIDIAEKAGRAVIAALDDMKRDPGDLQSG
jgi:hypothetical protein